MEVKIDADPAHFFTASRSDGLIIVAQCGKAEREVLEYLWETGKSPEKIEELYNASFAWNERCAHVVIINDQLANILLYNLRHRLASVKYDGFVGEVSGRTAWLTPGRVLLMYESSYNSPVNIDALQVPANVTAAEMSNRLMVPTAVIRVGKE